MWYEHGHLPDLWRGNVAPATRALFTALLPWRIGDTLIVIVAVALIARLARGTVQVTVWPLTVQPVALLISRPAGTSSVTVASAVASAVPVLLTVMT